MKSSVFRSNCNLYAWSQFIKGEAVSLTLKKTRYSKWGDLSDAPGWRYVLYPIGAVLGYPAWALVQLGCFLMYGKWMHVTTDTDEFVPLYSKGKHWVPPLIFKGFVRKL